LALTSPDGRSRPAQRSSEEHLEDTATSRWFVFFARWYWHFSLRLPVYRRIGRNENDAIEILEELVRAQREYASASHDGAPAGTYASKKAIDQAMKKLETPAGSSN
jgi:hypothetical protein